MSLSKKVLVIPCNSFYLFVTYLCQKHRSCIYKAFARRALTTFSFACISLHKQGHIVCILPVYLPSLPVLLLLRGFYP